MKKLLSAKQVSELLGVTETTIWRYGKNDSRFPNRIVLSPRCVRYDQSEVEQYIKQITENGDNHEKITD